MKILIFALTLLTTLQALAFKIEYLGKTEIPHQTKFQKTTIGGISALWYQADNQSLWVLSDDRGSVSEPRMYRLKLDLVMKDQTLEKFSVKPEQVVFIQQDKSKKNFRAVADLESMASLPWGNFLLGSEGDGNKKPRQAPQLLEIKPSGEFVREYSVPDIFLPEPSGKQAKGVRNNLAFEGLTQIGDKGEWILGVEAPLQQDRRADKASYVRWIQYVMPEAWVIKPAKQWLYQIESSGEILSFQNGVSEILAVNDKEVLALERRVEVGEGIGFKVKIFLANLEKASDVSGLKQIADADIGGKAASSLQPVSKSLVLDFESLTSKIGKIENFEGMAWGPKLPNGKSTLLLVSDDNFMRDLRTQILIFSVEN